jgi:hypothetical protein
MMGVVNDPETLADQLANAPTGPQCSGKATGFGALQNPSGQALPLAGG